MVAWLTRDDDDRDVSRVRVGRNLLPDRETAHDGKAEIEDDCVGRIRVEDAQGIEAVSRFEDFITRKRQRRAKHAAQVDVVLYDQDGLHVLGVVLHE